MFKDITTRIDMGNATWELLIMLGVACLLGFLFCYFRNQRGTEGD